MKNLLYILFLLALSFPSIAQKPRLIITTDGEIDDRSSFVRFLLYTSDFDVAGIIATNSKWQRNGHGLEWMVEAINLYGKVRPNLIKHNPNYPTARFLKSKLALGNEDSTFLTGVPPYKDSPGSELILRTLLEEDPRPIHVNCWGGLNTVAQAIWKLKQNYPLEVYSKAIAKIRIYAISFQDAAGNWIRKGAKEALIIKAGSWYQTWNYHPQKHNPYPELMSTAWLLQHVQQNHGPLGAWYPQQNVSEGDTPAFLPLIDNGLRSYEDYTWGGWGGRFRPRSNKYWIDAADDSSYKKAITRWVPAVQNDFAARMDWCVQPYTSANHHPIIQENSALLREVTAGQTIRLDAGNTYDPDKHTLIYRWWHYKEVGKYPVAINIKNYNRPVASFTVPTDANGPIHIILEVKDNGTPQLTTYKRWVFQVKKLNAVP